MSAKTDAGALLPRSNTPQASPHAVSLRKSIGLCALYGFTSVSITFFNKAVFSVYSFNFPCFVTLIQILVCISFLRAGYQADLYVVQSCSSDACFSVIRMVDASMLYGVHVSLGTSSFKRLSFRHDSVLLISNASKRALAQFHFFWCEYSVKL